jgi:hypothetical protein
MLLLKKHLVELVRAGKKRQTIRYWTRPIVHAGQISFTPGLGKMKILRVDELAGYQSLTLNDANDDGFDTLDELLAELKRNYPQVPPGKRLYRVVFQWPLEAPAQQTAAPSPIVPAKNSLPEIAKPERKRTTRTAKAAMDGNSPVAESSDPAGCMSVSQRQTLRQWVIAQKPKST